VTPAEAIGRRVRELRRGLGLSQSHVAQLAGLHASNVVRLERGRHEPTLTTVWTVAVALGVEPSRILSALDSREVVP
jgi:transcriptional regulator with XRE-family HTH domain